MREVEVDPTEERGGGKWIRMVTLFKYVFAAVEIRMNRSKTMKNNRSSISI